MSKSNVAFSNLRAEMARKNITIAQIANLLGVSRNTASSKLSRERPINLDEACAIKNNFFPDKDIFYLFHEATQQQKDKPA